MRVSSPYSDPNILMQFSKSCLDIRRIPLIPPLTTCNSVLITVLEKSTETFAHWSSLGSIHRVECYVLFLLVPTMVYLFGDFTTVSHG